MRAGLNEGSELCFLLGSFLTGLEATEVSHLRFEVLMSFRHLILNGVPELKASLALMYLNLWSINHEKKQLGLRSSHGYCRSFSYQPIFPKPLPVYFKIISDT